ncbi:FG-GAP-like repeat-containing protein [Streptomyces sp. NPDC000888]
MRRNTTHKTHRLVLATATAASLTGGLLTLTTGTATAATPAKYADDFNGDGYRDYAVGDSGSATVTYGTATGPGTVVKTFSQSSAGIPGTAGDAGGYGEDFGDSLANADFNRDGYTDLAVGDHSEKVSGKVAAGAVTIMWGSSSGLGSSATGLSVTAHSYYGFGDSLATGDFNGDGKADLAVADSTQATYIYRGGFAKSGTTGKVTKHVPSPSVADILEPTALVAGKVTKDKATDLYVRPGLQERQNGAAAWFLCGGTTVKSGIGEAVPPRPTATVRQQRLGAELRKLRERAGLNSLEARQKLRVDPARISNIESGRFGVSAECSSVRPRVRPRNW